MAVICSSGVLRLGRKLFQVSNGETKAISVALFWCNLYQPWTYFITFCTASVIDLERVNASCWTEKYQIIWVLRLLKWHNKKCQGIRCFTLRNFYITESWKQVEQNKTNIYLNDCILLLGHSVWSYPKCMKPSQLTNPGFCWNISRLVYPPRKENS